MAGIDGLVMCEEDVRTIRPIFVVYIAEAYTIFQGQRSFLGKAGMERKGNDLYFWFSIRSWLKPSPFFFVCVVFTTALNEKYQHAWFMHCDGLGEVSVNLKVLISYR